MRGREKEEEGAVRSAKIGGYKERTAAEKAKKAEEKGAKWAITRRK